MADLKDCVAVVTGASRGAGRGIASELGAAGATVYVTGRSTRSGPARSYRTMLQQTGLENPPGSIDETAEDVTRAGGLGIAVRCDHTSEWDVAALFHRVREEQGRLDLLVNNAWGGHEAFDGDFHSPFWEFYDLAKAAMTRLAFGMAQELRPHGIASVAVSPGWMRTEFVLAAHHTDERHWRDHRELAGTESPRYVGRAIAALASDPRIMERTGEVLRVGDLAREYGFTDVDGRRVPAFEMPGT